MANGPKIILASLLFLCGCSFPTKLQPCDISPMNQVSGYQGMTQVAADENGFFALGTDGVLYYYENDDTPVYVCELSYQDDVPFSGVTEPMKRYQETALPVQIYVYDDRLLYCVNYLNTDGVSSFTLMSISKDGSARQKIISFSDNITGITVHRNMIFALSRSADSTQLAIYDFKGKVLYRKESYLIDLPVVDGGFCYFTVFDEAMQSDVFEVTLDDFAESVIIEDAAHCFANNGRFAVYDIDGMKAVNSRLIDREGNILLALEDECRISYHDENHIYVTDRRHEPFQLVVYDWQGKEVQRFRPEEHGLTTFVSDILRVIHGKIICEAFVENDFSLVAFDISKGSCAILGR